MVREVAPNTFAGSGMAWEAHVKNDDILAAGIASMERGADFFYTNRSLDAIELLSKSAAVSGLARSKTEVTPCSSAVTSVTQ